MLSICAPASAFGSLPRPSPCQKSPVEHRRSRAAQRQRAALRTRYDRTAWRCSPWCSHSSPRWTPPRRDRSPVRASRAGSEGQAEHLLVCECKRVHGWRWAFARGYQGRGSSDKRPRADLLESTGPKERHRTPCLVGDPYRPYEHQDGDEGRSAGRGLSNGTRRPRKRVGQALRARGGVMNHVGENPLRSTADGEGRSFRWSR